MIGAKYVWGIEIGGSAVKGVKLLATPEQYEIIDFEVLPHKGEPQPTDGPIPDKRAWRTLAHFQERHRIRSEHVVVSVPGNCVFSRPISLIEVGGKPLHELVRFEAQQQVGIDLEAVLWDYEVFPPLREGDPARQGVLFAMKKADYNTFIRSLDAARIQVDDVQTVPLAIYNYIRFAVAPESPSLIFDIGARTVDMVAVFKGRYWTRSIPIGGDQVTQALQQSLGCDYDSAETIKLNAGRSNHAREVLQRMLPSLRAIAVEIRGAYRLLRGDVPGVRFDRAITLGGAARTLGLARLLSQELGCTIHAAEGADTLPLAETVDARSFAEEIGVLAPAVGLALQGASRAATEVSLVSAGTVRGKHLARTRPFAIASLAVLAVLITLSLVFTAQKRAVYAEANEKLSERLARVRSRFSRWQKIGRQTKREDTLLADYKKLGLHRGTFLDVLKDVERLFGPTTKRRMWLRTLGIKVPRSQDPAVRYTKAKYAHVGLEGATERRYREKETDTRRSVTIAVSNRLRGIKEVPKEPPPSVSTVASTEPDQVQNAPGDAWKYLLFSAKFHYYFDAEQVPKPRKKEEPKKR